MKRGQGILGKLRLRSRRRNLVKALKNYFMSDSYMYGPIVNPKNYRTSLNASAISRKPSRQETLWQTKRTCLTLSSLKVHKTLIPSLSNQSNETGDPTLSGDHGVNFRDIPIESNEIFKHAIDHSAAPSTVDNINQTDRPETVAKRIGENKIRSANLLVYL